MLKISDFLWLCGLIYHETTQNKIGESSEPEL